MPLIDQARPLREPASPGDARWATEIEQIVAQNALSGRFDRIRCERSITLEEYTDLVGICYATHHHLVTRLSQRDHETWQHLWLRLFHRAYDLLLQRGWSAEEACERAQEAAQDACMTIYCKAFPYDCSFDAWALLILRRHVFRDYHRSRSPLDHPQMLASPDTADGQSALPHNAFDANDETEPLLAALRKLQSRAQRQAIEYLYFQGLDSAEAAQRMGKSVQAIYNLTNRALARLRVLLVDDSLD